MSCMFEMCTSESMRISLTILILINRSVQAQLRREGVREYPSMGKNRGSDLGRISSVSALIIV